jgi:hypothetical protein
MSPEIGMCTSVLARWPKAQTIVEYCFKLIEICADDVRMLVRNQSHNTLSYALGHDPGLAVVHVETFLKTDGSNM